MSIISIEQIIRFNFHFLYQKLAPTAPPQNFVGNYLDSTSIYLDWDEPPAEHQNGIIREYHINFTEIETGNAFFKVVATDSATISSLHPNYNYYITITAVTVLPGPTSPTIVVMTPEDGMYSHNAWCTCQSRSV